MATSVPAPTESTGSRMTAAVATRYGPPDVIELQQVETPVPADHEVLVRVHATTVTAADYRIRGFSVPWSYWLPARVALGIRRPKHGILGMEFAGEIEAVGADVDAVCVGQPVFGLAGQNLGANAEFLCLDPAGTDVALAPKPPELTYEQAAALPLGGLTALQFLREADIHEGTRVMIYGASGSVGTYAVQLATYFGATVTGVCSTDNLELVSSLGADAMIDYTVEDVTRINTTYDVIFDTVGKCPYGWAVRSLATHGAFLHAVGTPAVDLRMRITELRSDKRTVGGVTRADVEALSFLGELVASGVIDTVIDRTYPLDQVVDAHSYADTRHKTGNVVLAVTHGDPAPAAR